MNWYRDRVFYIAMTLGPLFWGGYGLFFYQPSTSSILSVDDVWQFLQVGLIYPVLEEVVFRGGLQSVILASRIKVLKFAGLSAANVLTSLVFAGMHLFSQDLVWACLIFFPSLVFGYFYDRYGRLLPSIVLHAFYNSGFFIFFPV